MKKLNAVLMFIVLISSNILAQTNNIEVNGTLRGVKYGELIISEHDNVGEPSVIHIKSKIENGKVNITAPIEYPFKGIIFVKGTNYKTYWFFEPGDSYTVQIFNKDLIIEGGKTEKLMFESGAVSQEIMEMNMKFMGDEAGAIVSEDEKEIKKVMEEYEEFKNVYIPAKVEKFVRAHPNSINSAQLIGSFTRQISYKKLKELYNLYNDTYKKSPTMQYIAKRIEDKKRCLPGQPIIDLTLQDENGKSMKLSSVKDKLNILLFWTPGKDKDTYTNETLKVLSDKYHEKGLSVVTIAFLKKGEHLWKRQMVKDQPKWYNLVDPKAYNSDAIKVYDPEGTPLMVVYDSNGNIVTMSQFISQIRDVVAKEL